MKRVEENLGSIGSTKVPCLIYFTCFYPMLAAMHYTYFHYQGRSVHNTVMELRNICNHPYLSQLHSEEASVTLHPQNFISVICFLTLLIFFLL